MSSRLLDAGELFISWQNRLTMQTLGNHFELVHQEQWLFTLLRQLVESLLGYAHLIRVLSGEIILFRWI